MEVTIGSQLLKFDSSERNEEKNCDLTTLISVSFILLYTTRVVMNTRPTRHILIHLGQDELTIVCEYLRVQDVSRLVLCGDLLLSQFLRKNVSTLNIATKPGKIVRWPSTLNNLSNIRHIIINVQDFDISLIPPEYLSKLKSFDNKFYPSNFENDLATIAPILLSENLTYYNGPIGQILPTSQTLTRLDVYTKLNFVENWPSLPTNLIHLQIDGLRNFHLTHLKFNDVPLFTNMTWLSSSSLQSLSLTNIGTSSVLFWDNFFLHLPSILTSLSCLSLHKIEWCRSLSKLFSLSELRVASVRGDIFKDAILCLPRSIRRLSVIFFENIEWWCLLPPLSQPITSCFDKFKLGVDPKFLNFIGNCPDTILINKVFKKHAKKIFSRDREKDILAHMKHIECYGTFERVTLSLPVTKSLTLQFREEKDSHRCLENFTDLSKLQSLTIINGYLPNVCELAKSLTNTALNLTLIQITKMDLLEFSQICDVFDYARELVSKIANRSSCQKLRIYVSSEVITTYSDIFVLDLDPLIAALSSVGVCLLVIKLDCLSEIPLQITFPLPQHLKRFELQNARKSVCYTNT